jgi:hypothetical protein
MKFFMDENFVVQVSQHLRTMFPWHDFVTTQDLDLEGEKDLRLFPRLRELGMDAIITHDLRHLQEAEETRSLFDNKLHWIGMKQTPQGVRGVTAIALQSAAIIAALPLIEQEWNTEPTAYKINALQRQPNERFTAKPLAQYLQSHSYRTSVPARAS